MQLGFTGEALTAFRVAAGCDLRLHWAHLGIANSQFALGQFEQAEDAMQVASPCNRRTQRWPNA